jgi:hypothetical protein
MLYRSGERHVEGENAIYNSERGLYAYAAYNAFHTYECWLCMKCLALEIVRRWIPLPDIQLHHVHDVISGWAGALRAQSLALQQIQSCLSDVVCSAELRGGDEEADKKARSCEGDVLSESLACDNELEFHVSI